MFGLVPKKGFTMALASLLVAGAVAGCAAKDNGSSTGTANGGGANKPAATEISGKVTASGSTALLPLVKQAADEFMKQHPKTEISVTGGGSGTGLKQVANGEVDIGNSDLAAGEEFKDKNLVDHVVAIAPFALIVNKSVAVDNLTKQQAADIFSGKIKNWKEVGGQDENITIIHRPESSGSRKLVKQIVLDNGEFTTEGVVQESSGAMKTAVAQTSGAIGYVDTPYLDDSVKELKIDGVAYSKEAIQNGTYKLYGVEHMYTKGEPQGAVKAFLDYILSPGFQNTQVEKIGFLPANLLSGK